MGKRRKKNWKTREELAAEINKKYDYVLSCCRRARNEMVVAVRTAQEAGVALLKVKGNLRNEGMRGRDVPGFMEWVEKNTKLSHRTANVYMRIAKNWFRLKEVVEDPKNPPSLKKLLAVLGNPRDLSAKQGTYKEGEGERRLKWQKSLVSWIMGDIWKEVSVWEPEVLHALIDPLCPVNLGYELKCIRARMAKRLGIECFRLPIAVARRIGMRTASELTFPSDHDQRTLKHRVACGG